MYSHLRRPGILKLVVAVLVVAFLSGLLVSFNAPAKTVFAQQTSPTGSDQALIELYKKVIPSVVSISVRIPNDPNAPGAQPDPHLTPIPFSEGDGSGFVFSEEGYIVTNAHVVLDSDRVQVTFSDDTTLAAKIVGIDRDSDLAVVQVPKDKTKLVPLPIGNSDQLQVGQSVVVIGNPFGFSGSMSRGIVSGLSRRFDSQAVNDGSAYQIPGVIQTDAAINPGNSGGPLLDMDGNVLGVVTGIESRVRQSSGVSFAVPGNLIKKFIPVLIKDGKVHHAYLGIKGGDLDVNLNELLSVDPDLRGVLVSSVTPDSPAAKAGIKGGSSKKTLDGAEIDVGGDIIISVDKQPIRHFEALLGYLFTRTEVGQQITVTVLRDGKQVEIPVTLDERPY